MALHENPLRAAMVAVAAEINAGGGGPVEHFFGEKDRAAHGAPPRYVWVPTKARPNADGAMTPDVDQHRHLFDVYMTAEIDCWGVSHDQCDALVQNLLKGLQDTAAADFRLDGIEYPRAGAAWNQQGELARVEVSISRPFADVYVSLEEPEAPDVVTVIPTSIVADIQSTDDLAEDGETALTVDTTPEE